MADSHKGGAIAIAAIVALVLGGGVGYAVGNSDMGETQKSSTTSMNKTDSTDSADGVTVGGAKMVRTKDIVDNAAAASNVKTVVSLVQMAGLVETLKSEGPFTVFGPNDGAFAKLDKATVESLQKEENVEALKNILTYHVVAGTYTSADLRVMAAKGETLTTVQGQQITLVNENNMVMLQDAMGNKVEIETPDVISSNGVTHVIKSVLMPTN
jgi:uncharacterized surface protein with fasciclin (FAS1) repeats